MREIIKKGNNSPESEPNSKRIKFNSSSSSSYTATGITDSSREECANISSSLNDDSPRDLELGCYQTGNTMVVKQEGVGLDIKPDPETGMADSPSVMNGEDSLKNNLFTKQNYDSKIKLELVNGNITETDLKPTVSDTGLAVPNTNISTTPSNTPPQNIENCSINNEATASTKNCSAGVATSDAQYMQQQSQIFVFTTQLANKAAEEMAGGTFSNIIQYHCSQPATRKLLEKHPLKVNQFSKTNPSQWVNSMALKGTKSGIIKSQMGSNNMNEMGSMSNMASCISGPQENPITQQNMMMNPMAPSGSHMMAASHMAGMGMAGPRSMIMHPSGMPNTMAGPMMPGSMNPRMQVGRSPDDDLTPEQRKHREEQLSRMKDMATWLLPELGGPSGSNDAQTNAQNCMNNNGMSSTQQSNNNNPVLPQTPTGLSEPPSNSLSQHCPSNPCSGPNPNSCSIGPSCAMQGSCTGPMQGSCSGSNPTAVNNPDSCSNSMLSSAGPMSVGPPRTCSNPQINGNCGLPMSGNCSGPCSNVITSPVSLQPNACSGPISCTQTSTAPCIMTGSTNCQTNTSSGNPMSHNQPLSSSCSQNNLNIGPSPVPGMESSGLGHSPNMGPSPGMMGPGMGIAPGMMGSFCPMVSQPNMMMGQGPMGNPMMAPSQPGMIGNGMGPGVPQMRIMNQGNPMMMGGPNSSVAAQMDWQRTMAEQMELKRKKGQMPHDGTMVMMGPGPHMGGPMMTGHMMSGPMHGNMGMMPMGMRQMGPGPVNRMQGPPPPYHGPAPRSMGNGPLPSPGSPSMCPITSPRMPNNCPPNAIRMSGPGSGIDSPRPSCSNPPTPVSSGSVASPLSLKDQNTPQSVSNDMPYGRQLQTFAQQKQQLMAPSCGQQMPHMPTHLVPNQPSEPSLMPVPSPQQIQYLNTFDGQELTIQKQPNTSLRDSDILSPLGSTLDGSNDNLTSLGNKASCPTTPQPGPSTPHTPLTDTGRYNNGPQTPDRFPVPSPGMAPPSTPHTPQQQNGPALETKPSNSRFGGPSPQSQSNSGGPKTPSLDSRFPIPSPKTPGIGGCSNTPIADPSTQRFHGASPLHSVPMNELNSLGKFPATSTSTTNCPKMGSGFSPGKIPGLEIGAEFCTQSTGNLPLDPAQGGLNNAISSKTLDPISSMAQMSQQLGASGQPGSPPIPSASTPTLPTGPIPIAGQGPTVPNSMIDNQVSMMGIPPVSSSPAMMSGPVPSPVSGGPNGSSPGNMGMMPINPGMMSTNPGIMHGNPSMMPGNSGMMPGNPVMMSGNPGLMPGNPGMMPGNPGMIHGNLRMVGPGLRQPGPNGPFNGNSVQVKPNAPSTMHYMPVRPQNTPQSGTRGPTNMEFISRFNAPVGLEKPGSPMFSNNSTPNSMCGPNVPMPNMPMNVACSAMGASMNVPGGMVSMSSQMAGQNVPVGTSMTQMSGPSGPFTMNGPSGHVSGPNVHMGMGPNGPMSAMAGPMGPNGHMMVPNGPMMGPNGPMGMNPAMMSNGPIGPNGQMMGPRGMPHMMRGPNPAAMMGAMGNDIYGMSGPPGGMPVVPMGAGPPSGSGHPGQNQMMSGPAPMFASKGSPGMGMGSPMGSAPDTAQPLPPSMGQSGNYKNSHFIVPTTADPNYAVQFHNFQQQLYATNTRVGQNMGPMGAPIGPHGVGPGMPGPPHMVHQFPFNPK